LEGIPLNLEPCRRCQEQGQPENFSSPIKCGFLSGSFDPDNWQCGTLNALRSLIKPDDIKYNEDCSVAVLPCFGTEDGFLLLTWYKRRGAVAKCDWIDLFMQSPATLEDVEATIEALEAHYGN
jgi:hypothetical protein